MKYLFLLGTSLAAASPALAAEDAVGAVETGDNQITVVATGHGEPLDQSGQSIAIITADELAKVQGADITRVLERLPGVTWARNGGLGSQTALFVRGANSQQLLVTIDGVRVEDTAAPSGGFDFANLESGGIERIELLRGSNSVAWGSNAMGGVLAITTREVDGLVGAAEYGAHETLVLQGGAGLAKDAYAVSLDAGYTRSDGISAAAAGTENDPYRQWRISGKARLKASETLQFNAVARHSDSRIAFDSWMFVDDPEYQTGKLDSGRVGFDYGASDSFSLSGGVAMSNTHREYFDPSWTNEATFVTSGRSVRADLSGHAALPAGFVLDFGADSEWTRFSTTYDQRQKARLASGHALLGWHQGAVHLTGGVRLDDHDRFGSHWTFGANGAIELGGDLRLKASYGEGFKAPTLYQLYGWGGNAGLEPETSRSYDAGIELGNRNGTAHAALTVFRRDSANLIDYVWPDGYFNVARARAEGVEIEGGVAPSETLRFKAAYTYVKATSRDSGLDLARRPREALTLSADWTTPLAGLVLGADLRIVGDSFDDRWNSTRLDGYVLATLRASVPVGEHFELFARVENLTDESYQTAAGYGTYGRSAYGGVRLKW